VRSSISPSTVAANASPRRWRRRARRPRGAAARAARGGPALLLLRVLERQLGPPGAVAVGAHPRGPLGGLCEQRDGVPRASPAPGARSSRPCADSPRPAAATRPPAPRRAESGGPGRARAPSRDPLPASAARPRPGRGARPPVLRSVRAPGSRAAAYQSRRYSRDYDRRC
jgi:hypothetical protein